MGSSALVGSSISSTSGSTASARAMHSRCCWPPERPSALFFSRSFTSSQIAAPRSERSTMSSSFARRFHAVRARAVGDVVVNAHRERVRLLKHHADLPAQLVHVRRADRKCRSLPIFHLPGDFHIRHQVVHAVERFEKRRFAAAGRADQCGDALFRNAHADILERLMIAVPQTQVPNRDTYRSFSGHPPVQHRFKGEAVPVAGQPCRFRGCTRRRSRPLSAALRAANSPRAAPRKARRRTRRPSRAAKPARSV